MRRKSFVSILEMMAVVAVLFIAFGIFFPGFSYQTRWSEGLLLLKNRDVILTIDRTNNLYTYSFDSISLRSFLDKVIPTNQTNLIHWSEIDGVVKSRVVVACNCTSDQASSLISWIGRVKVNGRYIDVDPVVSNLDPIFPASDVLLIWGQKDLSNYKTQLQDYLKSGRGIVEITNLPGELDDVQRSLFGLARCSDISPNCGWGKERDDSFLKPTNAGNLTYQAYKYFHHIPAYLRAPNSVGFIPIEGNIAPCPNLNRNQGNFTFREDSYGFWICNETTVYFDINRNGNADKTATKGEKFEIDTFWFFLNYIDDGWIGVTFLQGYEFKDFLKEGDTRLYPIDQNKDKILLAKGTYANTDKPIPVVVLNSTGYLKTAWISDFSKNAAVIGDDHKMLLASLLFWASNKKSRELGFGNLKIGYLVSYINTVNQDMFEIYRFDLGLGYPF